MGRPVVLSNGSLFVGLNEQGLVHDFYYPYVGLDNLTTARSIHHKVGIWVDDTFSWVDDDSWDIAVDFLDSTLVSDITMRNKALGVELKFKDFVDHEFNVLCRIITINNTAETEREIRVYMHQVFEISRAGRGDTALFEPDNNCILDYKGRCSLLIYGQTAAGNHFDQFAIGNYSVGSDHSTSLDAEDGELSNNPVEHGGVDSVIRLSCRVKPRSSETLHYWVIAADSQYTAEKIHHRFLKVGLTARFEATKNYWMDWLNQGADAFYKIPSNYHSIVRKSLMIIKAHVDRRGGILASGDSSIYNYGKDYYSYVWPRDGAYAVWPLIRMGYLHEARQFFEFCRDIISPDGYLMHKFQPDRAIGSTWHPLLHGHHKELAIQEDETAIVVYMLGEYHKYAKDNDFIHKMYDTFIFPAAEFMSQFIDEQTGLPHASYDLWEEKFLTNTYTAAITYQALLVAAHFAKQFGHPDHAHSWETAASGLLTHSSNLLTDEGTYAKGFLLKEDGSIIYDNTLDISSVYGVTMFGFYGDSDGALNKSVDKMERTMLDISPSGGLPRYEHDKYFESNPAFMGNPWFVSTLWLAQYYLRIGDKSKAEQYITWTLRHTYHSGVLSEQIDPNDASPKSVAPLVWSHAELINTILDFSSSQSNQ